MEIIPAMFIVVLFANSYKSLLDVDLKSNHNMANYLNRGFSCNN